MMGPYKLYWREGSGSLVVEVALAQCGVPFERIRVDTRAGENRKEDFLALNPAGTIPVLVLPNGEAVSETAAILVLLDETHPQAGLLPPLGSVTRAAALRWLMLMATTGYSAALRSYRPERFGGEANEAARGAVVAAADAESNKMFAILASAATGPWLCGEVATTVDVYAAMLADWHAPALELPAIKAIYEGVQAHPAIGPAWKRHEGGTA